MTKTFPIASTGTLAKGRSGCAQPYALISFEGKSKQLIFGCTSSKLLQDAGSIELSYSIGLFGFAVIYAQQIKMRESEAMIKQLLEQREINN